VRGGCAWATSTVRLLGGVVKGMLVLFFLFVFCLFELPLSTMSCRQNTIVCSFDRQSSRLSAHEIHDWIGTTLALTNEDLLLVLADGARQVYVKFRKYTTMNRIVTSFRGGGTVRHTNGEISTVRIESAGMGTKRIRLANCLIA
jgi:hypothetical protein